MSSGITLRAALALVLFTGVTACGEDSADEQAPGPPFSYPLDEVLRLNHLQVKGTHNSYHLKPQENTIAPWNYSHLPLDQQFDSQGVRAVELDVSYSAALGYLEVFHLGGGLDEQTTCRIFTDCLSALERWSTAHPAHHPIFIQIEVKDALEGAELDALLATIESEILSVWNLERIVTPDLVKGQSASLKDALATSGWPTLGKLRGRTLFFFDNGGTLAAQYTRGNQNLDGRLLFVPSSPQDPYAAVAKLNDPIPDAAAIAEALAAGMIVRTRSDADSVEPSAGDTSRREAALTGGAQIVSTDYPAPVSTYEYHVEIPGGSPTRCNPVTAPAACTSLAIENPSFMKP
jgi:hypothetical protein